MASKLTSPTSNQLHHLLGAWPTISQKYKKSIPTSLLLLRSGEKDGQCFLPLLTHIIQHQSTTMTHLLLKLFEVKISLKLSSIQRMSLQRNFISPNAPLRNGWASGGNKRIVKRSDLKPAFCEESNKLYPRHLVSTGESTIDKRTR